MKYVPKAITRTIAKNSLRLQTKSPTLLFAAGVVGMGATIVLACRATMKVEGVLVDHEKDLLDIQRISSKDLRFNEAHWERERQHVMLRTTIRLVKLYSPAAVTGVITIGCLTTSHRQLTSRNAALTGAYIGLQRFLEEYRGRVRKAIGPDREQDVYRGSTAVTLAEDTANGPKTITEMRAGVVGPMGCVFGEENANWQPNSNYNEHFFETMSSHLTDKLRLRGHMFLNEVFDALGCPRSYLGQFAGWALGTPNSDDFVDVMYVKANDSYHGSYILDFNVGGDVTGMVFGAP